MDAPIASSSASGVKRAPTIPKKNCATCHKQNVYEFQKYKNCSDCREKNRVKEVVRRERKALVAATLASLTADTDYSHITTSGGDSGEESDDENLVATMLTPTGALKRKASKPLRDMNRDEKRVAMTQLKTTLEKKAKSSGKVAKDAPVVRKSVAGATEYQTAATLYDALKLKAHKPAFNFNGYHSIVTVPTIDDRKRIDLVTNELYKTSRLAFDHTKASHTYDFKNGGRMATFKCTCPGSHAVPQAVPPAVPSTASKAGAASAAGIKRKCGGKITIVVVNDVSHPFIPGQRISVHVEHSKSA